MNFSRRLVRLMAESGTTIREVAECAGVSTSTVDSWRAGTKSPSDYDAVYRVAQKFGVSFAYLLVGKDENPHQRGLSLHDLVAESPEVVSGIFEIRVRRIQEHTTGNHATDFSPGLS